MNDIFGFSGPLKYIIGFSNETQCVLGAPSPKLRCLKLGLS
jgi:hypothetical protein